MTSPDEIISAIDAASSSGASALNLLSTPVMFVNRQIIMERVASLRLPTMHLWPETVEEGGFIGYRYCDFDNVRFLTSRAVTRSDGTLKKAVA